MADSGGGGGAQPTPSAPCNPADPDSACVGAVARRDPAAPPPPGIPHAPCPPHVLAAIHGSGAAADPGAKKAAYEKSLNRWWETYSDRKNDEGDEHVADSLLYDRNHLPRTAPAPDCVPRPAPGGRGGTPATPAPGEE